MDDTDPITQRQFQEFLTEEKDHHIRQENDVREILRKQDSIDRWRVPMQADMEHVKKTLFGNGIPGMDEIIRDIQGLVQLLVKLAWIFVGAIVSIVIGGTAYAIIYLIRASAP